jgi:3D (Asp-Asp-Asp) domain-containing protein
VRVEEEIVIEQQPLPFDSRFEPDPNAPLDTISTVSAGEFGLIAQRVRVRYENGQEASRTVEDEFVAREPVDAVQGYGTQISVRTLDTPNGPIEYWRAVEVYATSYSPSRAGTPPTAPNFGITYSGAPLTNGHIAVLRSWYPSMAGRLFYVPGYGVGTVADIGGGIPGRHWIDLGYTDEDWQQWAGTVTLYFLTPVPTPDQILWVLP